MLVSIRDHWPEYALEALGLGLFMVSACVFTALMEYPASPLFAILPNDLLRRLIIGVAMGLTAIGIIYSPIGERSGAHLNPAVTITFFRLGKIKGFDALFYSAFQTLGGTFGVFLTALVIRTWIVHPAVNYTVTIPGPWGVGVALVAEFLISFGLMMTVLMFSNSPRWSRWTGVAAGILIAAYVTLEAPLSGMSMNPARTIASAINARVYSSLWIYFVAPLLGMLLAAEVFVRSRGVARVLCAKLNPDTHERCIFICRFGELGS